MEIKLSNKLLNEKTVQIMGKTILEQMKKCKENNQTFTMPSVNASRGMPHNYFTGHELTGGNFMWALMCGVDNRWATPSQLKKNKMRWKKGSSMTWFLRPILKDIEDEKGNEKTILIGFAKYPMINFADVIDAPEVEEKGDFTPIEECEYIKQGLLESGLDLRHSQQARYYYVPSADFIHMLQPELFNSNKDYYSVLFHEIGHWTGHEKRLKRDMKNSKPEYAFEELVAELTSAFLCKMTGLDQTPRDDHAKYLNSWIKALGDDLSIIWKASTQAFNAVRYVQKQIKK